MALERGLNASAEANIQPASDRVTNIGYLLSLGVSTTIKIWLINLTASKELPILLLKLYNERAIGISRSVLDFASVRESDNQLLPSYVNPEFHFKYPLTFLSNYVYNNRIVTIDTS